MTFSTHSTNPTTHLLVKAFVLLLVLAILTYNTFAIVPAGFRGVKLTLGKPSEQVFSEGFHVIIPFVESMKKVDIRMARNEGEGEAASSDLQSVRAKVVLNYHLSPSMVAQLYSTIGTTREDIENRVIDPARPEAYKAVIAQFTAEELITKRTEVRQKISALLSEKLTRHGIILDEFSIINFAFSPTFSAAIEAKVKAEQEKQKADRDLQRIQVEAQQRITSARAEAEGLRLQRQEVTPLLLELRKVENQRLAIDKWNGTLPTTLMGKDAVPLISLAGSH